MNINETYTINHKNIILIHHVTFHALNMNYITHVMINPFLSLLKIVAFDTCDSVPINVIESYIYWNRVTCIRTMSGNELCHIM